MCIRDRCNTCVTMKTEVLKYDSISQKLYVARKRTETRHGPHSQVPNLVADGRAQLKRIDDRHKEANAWVDKKIAGVYQKGGGQGAKPSSAEPVGKGGKEEAKK
eukprot:TRINITY_DN21707_c0_g1_i1.p1 TRINITY_DN21707_c0_g1~~TRINITY_DN21707_c0_g1_i1.p1  ORF type:complete len:104 (+),score=23.72 TRINITY_DN21707_c0_g1_i1:184-495(+)